jgi:hypothetical protein
MLTVLEKDRIMSLTNFLKNKDVSNKFSQEFVKPTFSVQCPLLATPLTKNYSLVGTAFDYLLRFCLKRLNPRAIEQPWVAEGAVMTFALVKGGVTIDAQTGECWVEPKETTADETEMAKFRRMKSILSEAKNLYKEFLKTGKVTKDLLRSTLLLANLDVIDRTGSLEYVELDSVSDDDVNDLLNLYRIVDLKLFKAKKLCLLNPTFGEGSKLVGGADADLVLDDTLIEIKTTMKLQLLRPWFNQLIGYYCLYRLGGINGLPQDCEIKNFAVYFSRYAYLHVISVEDCIRQVNFPEFLAWLKHRAEKT